MIENQVAYAGMQKDIRELKLANWARNKLELLRESVKSLDEKVRQLVDRPVSRIWTKDWNGPHQYLDVKNPVEFDITVEGERSQSISVYLKKDEKGRYTLELMGVTGVLQVRPRAANVIIVGMEDL